jgi:hypothetical protein
VRLWTGISQKWTAALHAAGTELQFLLCLRNGTQSAVGSAMRLLKFLGNECLWVFVY